MSKAFWKEAVVYQIYPRSFMDSNGDGIGDLQGIISKLDYLQQLGVDVIWLSPVYKSPNDDNGYDISDYRDIMDEFGTMEDWDQLLAGIHERGMKLMMDLVVNHCSDEHAWFVEARTSKNNSYRDYFIWRPANEEGQEPNNWVSFFGGSAWQLDEETGEYYLHLFSTKQPDLNWENPALRNEVYDMMNFWLDKGVDGFRMDVINCISKTPELPSVGNERYAWGGEHFFNGPRIHDYLREMNSKVIADKGIMTVGEMPGVSVEQAKLYTDEKRNELNMVFQFEHMDVDSGSGGKWDVQPWTLKGLRDILHKWQVGLSEVGWNSLYLNNHDQPRMVSRFGDDGQYRKQSAKMLATLLHTLRGTPYIYQGEELGMTNVRFESINDYRDIETLNMYREHCIEQGKPEGQVMAAIYAKGRDNARTPMQWNASDNAGFTTGTPWISVNSNYTEINAEQAVADPNSIFNYYKQLISLRKKHEVMVYGSYNLLLEDDERLYCYTRELNNEKWIIILNFFASEELFILPQEIKQRFGNLIISNYSDVDQTTNLSSINLRPYEARVYRLQ